MGYYDYISIESTFQMIIPGTNELLRKGMEGRQD
jgi:hypothetical protein